MTTDTKKHHSLLAIRTHAGRDSGASMVEYAILIMLIVLVAIAALRALGGEVGQQYSEIASAVVAAGPNS